MNLSVNWLNDFVDIKTDPKDFADKMTMSGSKVEMFDNIKRSCRKNHKNRASSECRKACHMSG